MSPVTKEQFFKAVGHLNVHPSSEHGARWSDEYGYKAYWKTQAGCIIGMTMGSMCAPIKKTYYLYEL